jgi:putative aldouronate transport system permease protein
MVLEVYGMHLQETNNKAIRRRNLIKKVFLQKYLFLMSVPLVIWVVIFSYIPLSGWLMAFTNYKPGIPMLKQQWVGLKTFIQLFQAKMFYISIRNTFAMGVLALICSLVFPVIFAVLINEIKNIAFKKTIQTVSYLPHFVSWVVVAGLFTKMLSPTDGIVNQILLGLNIVDKPVEFLAKPEYFWGIVTIADLWKEIGWNSIIYIAAITAINFELYEAAIADGASRLKRIWHITLPGIKPTIIILLIMNIGFLMRIGFEKQMLLGNNLVQDYAEVIDLYALQYGLQIGRFSLGTAVGIFNSVISVILLFAANSIAKRIGEDRLF